MRVSTTVFVALLAWAGAAQAQENEVYAIRDARIVTLAGPVIEKGTIVIRGGRISEVGADVAVPAGATVIEAAGLEVYPGLMDASSQLGLTEVGSTAATVDTNELGDYNPQLQAATAVHPSSEHIPVARANGITHAVSAPGGSGGAGIKGQASLMDLRGWTIEEMSIAPSVGMVIEWPSLATRRRNPSTFQLESRKFSDVKKEYDEKVAEIRDWIEAAKRYDLAVDKESNLELEALSAVTRRELPLLVAADDDRAIRDAVELCDDEGLRMVVMGGREAWKVKELLAERDIPVVVGPTLALPLTEDEPYDKPLTTARELQEAGVRVIFASYSSSNARLLPYEVGNAVAHGLPWEEGLKGITLYPAELYGVSDELGSIEEGKRANLIVTDGDPLEIRTEIKYLFIGGEPTPLDNKHLRLYETYRSRPRP